MEKLTQSEKLLAEKTVCILMLRGKDADNEPIYAYVAVRADMLEAFMAAQQKPDFNPEDYGVIVESGTGDPSPEVLERMEKDYGFNHEQVVHLSAKSDDKPN